MDVARVILYNGSNIIHDVPPPIRFMIIDISKFGTVLTSRPNGREAFLAFQPTLREIKKNEEIEIDFKEIEVLSPGWADEFLTPLTERYAKRVNFKNATNLSVVESLKILGLRK